MIEPERSRTATPHSQSEYLPARDRKGTALCLSGGGFRAALFHLGAVRRLYELGLLDEVTTIAAASGGSTLAAYLAQRCDLWRNGGLTAEAWEQKIAAPFRAITSRNLNTLPVLIGWMPWNWLNNAGVEALADACEARGVTRQTTADLPGNPRFLFESSDLVTGGDWIFERSSPAGARRVATAVAVSSCYPGFFRPFTESTPRRIALMDGGIHDDRALEPVWRTHRLLLISDGGDVLRPQWGESILWSLIRSAMVLWNQSQVVQKRWVISNFLSGQMDGTYWGIDSSPMHYLTQPGRTAFTGYTPALARDVIARIRTDYDAFSCAEAAVLENHGYFMVEAAARAHLASYCPNPPPLRIPHPAWTSETTVRAALRDSDRKRLFGRW
jgi:NTE family protein